MSNNETARRYRARKRGEDIPKQKPGPKLGYKQTNEHISKRIVSGEAHANWIGDAVSEKSGRSRAQRIFKEIGPCVLCGKLKSERHHIDANTANNEESNILIVCRKCHMEVDGRLKRSQQRLLESKQKASDARWKNRQDTTAKTGDVCLKCKKRISVVASRTRDGFKFTYLGCRKNRGGCGFNAGSIKTPIS